MCVFENIEEVDMKIHILVKSILLSNIRLVFLKHLK